MNLILTKQVQMPSWLGCFALDGVSDADVWFADSSDSSSGSMNLSDQTFLIILQPGRLQAAWRESVKLILQASLYFERSDAGLTFCCRSAVCFEQCHSNKQQQSTLFFGHNKRIYCYVYGLFSSLDIKCSVVSSSHVKPVIARRTHGQMFSSHIK